MQESSVTLVQNPTVANEKVLRLMTTGEIENLTGRSSLTVSIWRKAGLPYVRVPGDDRDSIRYEPQAAMKWLIEHGKLKVEDQKQEVQHERKSLD